MTPNNRLARVAGLLYLVVAVSGAFSQLYVRPGVMVAGDPAATAQRIRSSATLFEIGVAADLVSITSFIILGLVLYALFAPVDRQASLAFVILNAIAVAILGVNLLNHAGALVMATEPAYTTAVGAEAADALALLFLDLQRRGYLIAQIFFGLWLLPLGYVVYRSAYFPRLLGVMLMLGCFGYVADVVVVSMSPGFESRLSAFLALPAGLGEIAFLLWLLVKGVRVDRQGGPVQTVSSA